jgi:hypothetical protein
VILASILPRITCLRGLRASQHVAPHSGSEEGRALVAVGSRQHGGLAHWAESSVSLELVHSADTLVVVPAAITAALSPRVQRCGERGLPGDSAGPPGLSPSVVAHRRPCREGGRWWRQHRRPRRPHWLADSGNPARAQRIAAACARQERLWRRGHADPALSSGRRPPGGAGWEVRHRHATFSSPATCARTEANVPSILGSFGAGDTGTPRSGLGELTWFSRRRDDDAHDRRC